MNAKLTWGLAVCLIGFAGVSARAQSYPSYLASQYQTSQAAQVQRSGGHYHVDLHHNANAVWHGQYSVNGGQGAGGYGGGYGHGNQCPPNHCQHGCPPGQCPHGCRLFNGPNHRHYYSYSQPAGLVYPPANQPPAVVQYPYYINKGPDDFFLDRD